MCEKFRAQGTLLHLKRDFPSLALLFENSIKILCKEGEGKGWSAAGQPVSFWRFGEQQKVKRRIGGK